VTSQIASAINRLKNIGKLPQEMATTLLTIMKTSSVSEFNKVFAAIEVQKTLDDLNQSSSMYIKSFKYTAEEVIAVAEAQYLKLFEKGHWTGATTHGQDSTFPAQNWLNAKLQKCPNCGKPWCHVDICSTPKDESWIKANHQQFLDTRIKVKGGGWRGNGDAKSGTKVKFRKPDDDDIDNKHTIDRKLMYYHFCDGSWKSVDKTPAQIVAAKKSPAAKAAKLEAATPTVAGTTTTPETTGTPNNEKLRAVNLAKLVYEQLSIAVKAELEEWRWQWSWTHTMESMRDFLKATLIPGLIVGKGLQ
jgi:hypothetical protein